MIFKLDQNQVKNGPKNAVFCAVFQYRRIGRLGLIFSTAYSVPNIRSILAEYSVFGRTLDLIPTLLWVDLLPRLLWVYHVPTLMQVDLVPKQLWVDLAPKYTTWVDLVPGLQGDLIEKKILIPAEYYSARKKKCH